MDKIKKSVTISKDVAIMLSKIADNLGIPENAVISVAILEYYNLIHKVIK